jgi:hypothetical protein
MEAGEESGIVIEGGWRVNERGEKAPGGVRKKKGRPGWAKDRQPRTVHGAPRTYCSVHFILL